MQQNRKQNVRTIMNSKSFIVNLKRIRRDGGRCVSELVVRFWIRRGSLWVESIPCRNCRDGTHALLKRCGGDDVI